MRVQYILCQKWDINLSTSKPNSGKKTANYVKSRRYRMEAKQFEWILIWCEEWDVIWHFHMLSYLFLVLKLIG